MGEMKVGKERLLYIIDCMSSVASVKQLAKLRGAPHFIKRANSWVAPANLVRDR